MRLLEVDYMQRKQNDTINANPLHYTVGQCDSALHLANDPQIVSAKVKLTH